MKSAGIGFVLHTIAYRQLHAIFVTRIYDSLAFLAIHGHWLFTPHMLSGICGLYRKVLVCASRRYNVNNVNIVIIRNICHGAVRVHITVFNAVLLLPLRDLTLAPRDYPS